MHASGILICVAVLMLAAAIWDDLKCSRRVTPARKTYLLVACIFAVISAILPWLRGG
jgi:uncharacterized membrane protein